MYMENREGVDLTLKLPMNRQKISILLLSGIGIFLIIFSSHFDTYDNEIKPSDTPQYKDVSFYTSYLEERIRELCRSVDGIEEAVVFLTLDCSSEYVYSDDRTSDFLILSGSDGEQALMLYEIYPRIRGVAVVCTGGDLPRIRETITELLSAALALPSNKIKVAGG